MLEISLSYSQVLWPWSGWLAVSISVSEQGALFTGEAAGQITLTISTPTVRNCGHFMLTTLSLSLSFSLSLSLSHTSLSLSHTYRHHPQKSLNYQLFNYL